MTLFEIKAERIALFHETAKADGLLGSMNPQKRALLEDFLRGYAAWKAPNDALRDYHLKLAPVEAVYGRTKELEKGLLALFDAWCTGAGNRAEVLADIGAPLLADGEAASLDHLKALQAAFVRWFGAAGLPPAWRREALTEQEAAHLKARRDRPAMPPGQKLSELRAGQRDLSTQCDEAFWAYHDFLDGHFGRKGDEAYAAKAKYGYDRRAGHYQSAREKKPQQPAVVPAPAPGPVAAGTDAPGSEPVPPAPPAGATLEKPA